MFGVCQDRKRRSSSSSRKAGGTCLSNALALSKEIGEDRKRKRSRSRSARRSQKKDGRKGTEMHGSWTVDVLMSFDVPKTPSGICVKQCETVKYIGKQSKDQKYKFNKKSLRFGGFPLPGVKSRDRRSHSPPSKARMEHMTW